MASYQSASKSEPGCQGTLTLPRESSNLGDEDLDFTFNVFGEDLDFVFKVLGEDLDRAFSVFGDKGLDRALGEDLFNVLGDVGLDFALVPLVLDLKVFGDNVTLCVRFGVFTRLIVVRLTNFDLGVAASNPIDRVLIDGPSPIDLVLMEDLIELIIVYFFYQKKL